MPRDGIYKIQLGLKVGTFLGFERNANCPGGVAFLTKYQVWFLTL
jgi:hypothetical protein